MKQRFTPLIKMLCLGLAMFGLFGAALPARAVDVINCNIQTGQHTPAICQSKNDKLFGPGSIWTNVINTLIFVIGAIAVLMIVIGAMRYALSAGDQAQITSAKNTILYAVIGLVIALMAGGIVNFVLARF